MPDEQKHEDSLHELDKEPASGTLNDTNDTENRAATAWGGNSHTETETDDSADTSNTDVTSSEPKEDYSPVSPLHNDIAPATISMPEHRTTAAAEQSDSVAATEELPRPGPGLLVLQWLSYAFWGWTVLSLSGLIVTVINQLLNRGNSSWAGGIAYLLAAVIVLFIISLVTDVFYAKAERKHARSSGTNVIMIIHAVIFALFGIGSLIIAVFGLVSLLISDTSGGSNGAFAGIISGVIISVLYGLTLLRVLRPRWIKAVVPMYWIVMTLTILLAVTLGVVGPAAQVKLQNEDKVVEEGLPRVSSAINSYATDHQKLPASLNVLSSVPASGKSLIDQHLVTYKAGEKLNSTVKALDTQGSSTFRAPQAPVFHYELCVDYKAADSGSSYSYVPSTGSQQYPTSVYTYGHKAGHVCYNLQTGYIYN